MVTILWVRMTTLWVMVTTLYTGNGDNITGNGDNITYSFDDEEWQSSKLIQNTFRKLRLEDHMRHEKIKLGFILLNTYRMFNNILIKISFITLYIFFPFFI